MWRFVRSRGSAFEDRQNWVAVASLEGIRMERGFVTREEESGAIRLDEWGQSRSRRFTS